MTLGFATIRLRTLLPVLILAAIAVPVRASADSSTTVTRIPFETLLFVGVCLGSNENPYVVALRGEVTLVIHNGDGALTFGVRNERFTGLGLSDGVEYIGGQTSVSLHRIDRSEVTHVTFVVTLRLISPGVATNMIVHGTVRLTVDATGSVVVQRDEFRYVCVPSAA